MVQASIRAQCVCLGRFHNHCGSRNSLIIIVTRLPTEQHRNCCTFPRSWPKIFLYCKFSRPSLGPKQPLIQWTSAALSSGSTTVEEWSLSLTFI